MTALDVLVSVADVIYAGLRWLQTQGSLSICDAEHAVLIRILPILVLPFAATRAFWRSAWLLGFALICIELYFVYNRLTVFAFRPLVLAELVGNLGITLLGTLLLLPQRFWRKSLEVNRDD